MLCLEEVLISSADLSNTMIYLLHSGTTSSKSSERLRDQSSSKSVASSDLSSSCDVGEDILSILMKP